MNPTTECTKRNKSIAVRLLYVTVLLQPGNDDWIRQPGQHSLPDQACQLVVPPAAVP